MPLDRANESSDQTLTHDPEQHFSDPRRVVDDDSLSREAKLKILQSWKIDLLEEFRADEENMGSHNAQAGAVAKRLTEVTKAIERMA